MLTGANSSDDTTVAGAWDTMASGGARELANDNVNSTCAEFCLYCAMEQTSVDAAGDMTFDNEKDSTANALMCSPKVCRGSAPEERIINLAVTQSMVEEFKSECSNRVAGDRRRLRSLGDGWHGRRLAENTNRIIGSFQCEGSGKDLCDMSGGNLATVLERASLAKAASPSLTASSTGGNSNTPDDDHNHGSDDDDNDNDGDDGDGGSENDNSDDDNLAENKAQRLCVGTSTVSMGAAAAFALILVGHH